MGGKGSQLTSGDAYKGPWIVREKAPQADAVKPSTRELSREKGFGGGRGESPWKRPASPPEAEAGRVVYLSFKLVALEGGVNRQY